MASVYSALLFLPCVLGSLFDPHQFPTSGPFVEGWYIRISDHTTQESYAVLFGTVLPENPASGSNLAYIGLLRSKGGSRLKQKEAFPTLESVRITKNGKRQYEDPDANSPANFEFRADPYGFIKVNATNAEVRLRIDDTSLNAVIGLDDPWSGNTHLGPENWLIKLPLPLHWFVYSLASTTTYQFQNRTSQEQLNGTGTAHMEKNWGKGFPESWFWSQGHSASGVTLAMSGGWLRFGPIPVRGHLAGYRNQRRRISLDFRSDNSILSLGMVACRGFVRSTYTSFTHRLVVSIYADPKTFSGCLYGPMPNGFRRVCSESYKARIDVTLYRRRHYIVGDFVLVDREIIQNSALEFGGGYLCQICNNA